MVVQRVNPVDTANADNQMPSLNDDQIAAFRETLNFLNDPSRKFHRVSGGAGVGKTFFISKIAEDILKHVDKSKCTCSQVAITATTNKAAAVLKNSMPRKHMITTTYTFMNLRVHSDKKTGTDNVVPTPKWYVHFNTLLIVDEASMVSRVLHDYIDKGTASNCKILFVGDKYQLDPVKESTSPVYTNQYTESVLIEPMRNSTQPALMALCNQFRETVETKKFYPIQEVPGVIDYVNGNQTRGLLEREYRMESAARRVLCYTNQRAIDYNLAIREIRGYTQLYEVGEIMSNNSSAEIIGKNRLYADQIVQILHRSPEKMSQKIIPGTDIPVHDLEVEDVETGEKYLVTVFADPPDRKEVLKYWKSHKRWHEYFKVRDTYPDLRVTAASTVHKAQGSTFEDVIVDLSDIGTCKQVEMAARLLYVALSRPRNRLYLRGQLPERFGG